MSLFGFETTINIIIKAVIIIAVAMMTILGGYFVPRGKILVIICGVGAILVIWFIELEINL